MRVKAIVNVVCFLLNFGNISFISSIVVENMKEISDAKMKKNRSKKVKYPLDEERIGERYNDAYKAVKHASEIFPLSQTKVKRKQKRSSEKATPWPHDK